MKMLLDLYCGGGGASMGYHQAGYIVTGVDNRPQPEYPFEFIHADALEVMRDVEFLRQFDLIHASPPCQYYSRATERATNTHPALIAPTRELLDAAGVPYIIENVQGANFWMIKPLLICGYNVGLHISRHRLFESPLPIKRLPYILCRGWAADYAKWRGWKRRLVTITGNSQGPETRGVWQELMEIDWINRLDTLKEAIPPAYTRYLGQEASRLAGKV